MGGWVCFWFCFRGFFTLFEKEGRLNRIGVFLVEFWFHWFGFFFLFEVSLCRWVMLLVRQV